MTATSATLSSKLNRAEILVDGESDWIMDVASYMEPGQYPIELIDVDSDGYLSFRWNNGLPFWSQYMGTHDPHARERTYTLSVIRERASKT